MTGILVQLRSKSLTYCVGVMTGIPVTRPNVACPLTIYISFILLNHRNRIQVPTGARFCNVQP